MTDKIKLLNALEWCSDHLRHDPRIGWVDDIIQRTKDNQQNDVTISKDNISRIITCIETYLEDDLTLHLDEALDLLKLYKDHS